ncbi:MAG: glycosyl hydrolase family 28-related protein, partial [Verrucomicrobiota bacterium]
MVLLVFAVSAKADWRSELYPADWVPPTDRDFLKDAFIQDFSYAGYQLGTDLPEIKGLTYNVKESYGAIGNGKTDDSLAIQKAIDAAGQAGGGIVYLPPGTYRVNVPGNRASALSFPHNRVVLRGAGSEQTFLLNETTSMRERSIIRVHGSPSGDWRSLTSREALITRDLTGPVHWIPVDDLAGFHLGDWIILRSDATGAFAAEHHMGREWKGFQEKLRGLMFHRQIIGFRPESNEIRIDIPIRYALKKRDRARVHKTLPHREEIGLEGFSIANGLAPGVMEEKDYNKTGTPAHAIHRARLIDFRLARNCWMKDVRSYRPPSNQEDYHFLSQGVKIEFSRSLTLEDCHFQKPQYRGGGANGYLFYLRGGDCLLDRCSAGFGRHGFIFNSMQCSGNVIHGSLARHSGFQSNGKGCDHHSHLIQSNLIDQTTVETDFFESKFRPNGTPPIHGVTGTQTVFWNLVGRSYYPKRPYIVHSQQHGWGYVIGTSGPAAEVRLDGEEPARTDPVDWLEGKGKGDTLEPASLYQDQRRRRQKNQPPEIRLRRAGTGPLKAGDPLALEIAVQAPEDRNLSRIEVFNGPRSLGKPDPSGRMTWSLPAGRHRLRALAEEASGQTGMSNALELNIPGTLVHLDFNQTGGLLASVDSTRGRAGKGIRFDGKTSV